MYVPFEELPDTARIWIYQSDSKMTEETVKTISTNLLSFTNQWAAHNQPLKASFRILFDHFVVLGVDENYNQASGCSIDASVHAIKQSAQQMKIDFFTRTNVAFLKNNEVTMIPLPELTKALAAGQWDSDTLVFNNTLHTKGEFLHRWMIPSGETWLKRYLLKVSAQE